MIVLCRGRRLTLEDLCSAAAGDKVEVCGESYDSAASARASYEGAAGVVYGRTTGLGALAGEEQGYWRGREHTILVEHDLGVGPEAPREVVRAAMVVRASQLAQGFAPVRPEVLRRVVDAVNGDLTPVVSLQGSVGASGDLAPMARVARCLFYGEGEAVLGGRRLGCSEALSRLGLKPLELEAGEALALINTNAYSVGMAMLGTCAALRLVRESIVVMRRSLAVMGCNPQHFSAAVAASKPAGPIGDVVSELQGACQSSPRVQDPYCVRCVPQVYGAALEAIGFARGLLEGEASSSSENPIVYGGNVYHACNFHAVGAAIASDTVKVALAHVGNMVERRTAHLLSSADTGLPDFLAVKGSVVGAMIYQYTAASLAAQLRSLASPQSVHSIPTSGMQEDVVSMAPGSAFELLRAVASLARLIAVEEALAEEASMVREGRGLRDPREALEASLGLVLRESQLDGLGFLRGLA